MIRKPARPRHGTVVAYLALFVALSGTSYAAVTLSKNSVRSKHIKNGQVKKRDIGKSAVNSSKVEDGTLLSQDFKPGQLVAGAPGPAGPAGPKGDKGDTGAQGPAGPSTGAAGGELAGNYPNPTLAAGSVDAGDLGTITQRTNSVSIANGSGGFAQVECNAGEVRIAGGATTSGVGVVDGWDMIRSSPLGNGWDAAAWNSKGSSGTLIVEVLCLEV